ncbi:cytochrome c oxidase subunit II [Niallia nealsonii]|uniref:Cytochrome aa3 subunit 2 n=1 Tax=Niallia nealsonii TaxID=115979 RepID=A0A2N0Z3J3_9BACI|nr:cytochrome c oxidase subunit II [Niallia nealsonii]PKG24075.1 cytochrome B5 [Niallia nealsonii]
MKVHKLEKIILMTGGVTLLLFLSVLFLQNFTFGHHHAAAIETVDPKKTDETAPFNKPGLKKVSEKEWDYELVIVASVFQYSPSEVEIPVGAKVKIIATSKDVIHGLEVVETNINLMLEPGLVTEKIATFRKKGEYLVLCNEYCGNGHHYMSGILKVVDA